MPNSNSRENESAAQAAYSDVSIYWEIGCIDCCVWDMRDGWNAMSAMPFKPIGASLFKTSRKLKFLKRRSRPALRLDLDLAVVLSVAATAIRHTDVMVSTGANAGKKGRSSGAGRQ